MMLEKLEQSCALIHGMADRLGCDIPGAVASDPVSQATAYRSAVLRCNACRHHDDCQQLQNTNDRLDIAPDYCRNSWD
ncbi:hypothetical protein MACH17_42650 [Phaeobacter inhibens]|jgi:hypothetical protein|nr:hypothetical protein MACH17_42650 [Phaeobacter inhibens]